MIVPSVIPHYRFFPRLLVLSISLGSPLAPASAEPLPKSERPGEEPPYPRAVDASDFQAFLENSPFTRVLDLSRAYALTGIAEIDGEPVATIFDREQKKTLVISGSQGPSGWKLLDIEPGAAPEKAAATILIGGQETAVLRFDPTLRQTSSIARVERTVRTITIVSERGKKSDVRQGEERARYYQAIKERQARMSDKQREIVREVMAEKIKANPQWTPRDKGTLYLKVMDHVIEGDQ